MSQNKAHRKHQLQQQLRAGHCTQDELKELYRLMEQTASESEWDAFLDLHWQKAAAGPQLDAQASDVMLEQIRKRITSGHRLAFWRRIPLSRVAASVTLLIGLLWLLRVWYTTSQSVPEVRWITRSTGVAQRSVIRLKDGSVITLNAESSVSYPEIFQQEVREVRLSGEAFFEVEHESSRPFLVTAHGLITRVLGTSFNIRSYTDDVTEVTVASGKVRVHPQDVEEEGAVLTVSEQATYRARDRSLSVKSVELLPYLAWKSTEIELDMVPFIQVVEILERWYNVEITLKNHLADQCLVHARYKQQPLTTVLDGLRLLVQFDYQVIDEQHVEITGKACEETG